MQYIHHNCRLIYKGMKGGILLERRDVLSMDFKSNELYGLDALKANPIEAVEIIMNTYGNDIKKFVYNSSLRGWIYSIAANKCKDYLRKHRLRHNILVEKITRQQKAPKVNDVSEVYGQITIEGSLFEKVLELPIKYREVIILYYFKELSIKEISFILNEKESTLQSRLLRARRKLRDSINEGGIILG